MATKNSPQSFMSLSTILLLLTGLVAIYDFAQIHVMSKQSERLRQDLGRFVAAQARLAISQQSLTLAAAPLPETALAGISDNLQDDIEQFRQEIALLTHEELEKNLDHYAQVLTELRADAAAPMPVRQQHLQAIMAARNALHMDFTRGINALEQQLAGLNSGMLKTITRAVWLVITCVSIGMVFAMKGHHRLQNILIRPIGKMAGVIKDILDDNQQVHRLPIQNDPLLNELAKLINNLIDKQQRELDKGRQQLHDLQQAANTLVDILPRPTILFAGQHEIFLANKAAWDMLAGDAGKSLLAHMRDAIAKKQDFFDSHGIHFSLKTLHGPGNTVPTWLYIVEFARAKMSPVSTSPDPYSAQKDIINTNHSTT